MKLLITTLSLVAALFAFSASAKHHAEGEAPNAKGMTEKAEHAMDHHAEHAEGHGEKAEKKGHEMMKHGDGMHHEDHAAHGAKKMKKEQDAEESN